MNEGTQYGESAIVKAHFGDRHGLVVDVGAADGVTYSNSRFLIRAGWRGILIEPEPGQFSQLQQLYRGDPSVQVVQAAVAAAEGIADLFPEGTASTLVPAWRDHVAKVTPEAKYGPPVKVRTATFDQLLTECRCPRAIEFLSIDCEGMDLEALISMDFGRFDVELICIESGGVGEILPALGYRALAQTAGNSFWVKP